MDSRESVAESEQYDEAAMRRIHRPPNLPLPEVTHEAIPYSAPLLEGPPILGDPSTRTGVQFAPRPTLFVPFQFNQQLEGPAGHIQAQNVDLPEDIQQELAEAELRHEAARYQILEKAQRFPAASHSGAMAIGYGDSMMDERASGFPEAIITTSVPVDSHQTGNSMYGSGLGICSGQQMLQNTDYRSNYRDRIHDPCQLENAFLNIQESDYHALDLATCSQQPAVDPMALRAPYCNIKATDFNTPPGGSSWNGVINPSAHHSLTTAVFEPLSFPTINHSVATDVDMTGTDSSPLFTRTIGEQVGLPKRKRSSLYRAGDSGTQSGRALDNIHFYKNPDADLQCRESEPKRRRVIEKAPSSCFGCRLSKRKCTVLTGDMCLQCQNILKRYTDRTAIPNFTCTVRMSFFEMGMSMDSLMSQLSDREICDKLQSTSSCSSKTAQDGDSSAIAISVPRVFQAAIKATRKVLNRVRKLLDLLEPLHFRQMFPLDSGLAVLWSYSYSMIRWKSAIHVFWPDLQDVLESHEYFHRFLTLVCLVHLDALLVSKTASDSFLLLNIYCEGISAVEDTATVEYAARQHTLVALRHYIFHVYRKMFSKISTHNKHERDYDKLFAGFCWHVFPRTSELLPEGYQSRPYMSSIQVLNWNLSQEKWLTYGEPLVTTNDPTGSQDSLRQNDSLFRVEAYLPAEIAAIFGISKARLACYEEMFQNMLLAGLPESSKLGMLHLSRWSLSFGFRVFLDEFDFENGDEPQIDVLLEAILLSSFTVWDKACEFHHRRGALIGSLAPWELAMTDRVALEAFLIQSIASGQEASLLVSCGILKRCPGKRSQ